MNAHGFADDYWFSVQTLATIGYGYLAPNDALSNAVVTVESFVGIALTAMITGVFFARFATPYAQGDLLQGRDHRRPRRQAHPDVPDGQRARRPRSSRRPVTSTSAATRCWRPASGCGGSTTSRCAARPRRSSACRGSRPTRSTTQSPIADLTPEAPRREQHQPHRHVPGHRRPARRHGPHPLRVQRRRHRVRSPVRRHLFNTDPETGRRYLDFEKFDDTEPPLPAAARTVEVTATSVADRA